MTVASPFSLGSTLSADWRSGFNLRRMDFRALATALKAADIGATQTAWAKLREDSPRLDNALNHAPKASERSRVTALRTLATAIQAGDLAAAQTAFAAVQPHGQSVNRGQHRGHAVKESAPEATPATETTTAPLPDTTAPLIAATGCGAPTVATSADAPMASTGCFAPIAATGCSSGHAPTDSDSAPASSATPDPGSLLNATA